MGRKAKSFHVEAHGVRLRLYQVGPMWWADINAGGGKDAEGNRIRVRRRESLKTEVRSTAEARAVEKARELALSSLTNARPDRLLLGQLFAFYRTAVKSKLNKKGEKVSPAWQQAAETRMALFTRAWGADLAVPDIDQLRVDAYIVARRDGSLTPLTTAADQKGRKARPVRARVPDADLSWLRSCIRYAMKAREGGKPLLLADPLQHVSWPKEQNVRRPLASTPRYLATLQHTDTVDPAGRLRCVLALAHATGHRITAILSLRVSDLLRTREEVVAGLLAVNRPESDADHMPYGALVWRAEQDKQGMAHITTLSKDCRQALDAYLRQSGRMGNAVLFPAPENDAAPLGRRLASRWLLEAEALAKVPKLSGGIWHCYRRGFATARKGLPEKDVAAQGGWGDTRAMQLCYMQPDAQTALRVAEAS